MACWRKEEIARAARSQKMKRKKLMRLVVNKIKDSWFELFLIVVFSAALAFGGFLLHQNSLLLNVIGGLIYFITAISLIFFIVCTTVL